MVVTVTLTVLCFYVPVSMDGYSEVVVACGRLGRGGRGLCPISVLGEGVALAGSHSVGVRSEK